MHLWTPPHGGLNKQPVAVSLLCILFPFPHGPHTQVQRRVCIHATAGCGQVGPAGPVALPPDWLEVAWHVSVRRRFPPLSTWSIPLVGWPWFIKMACQSCWGSFLFVIWAFMM